VRELALQGFLTRYYLTVIWFGLVVATSVSFILGHEFNLSARLATAIVMTISYIKSRLVMMHFMELAHAPRAWRIVYEVWLVAVITEILLFYLSGVYGWSVGVGHK